MLLRIKENHVIYSAAGVAAFSAIAFELLLASYATFLLGATIFQYSLVISFMMASMGVGSLLVQLQKTKIYKVFLTVEIILAVLALVGVPALYYIFATQAGTRLVLLFFVGLTGLGIGMEIPLLNSLLPPAQVSRILFFDYFGGFVGGILFPLLLLPYLGFFRISGVLSLLSAGVGLLFFLQYKSHYRKSRGLFLALLMGTFVAAAVFTYFAEDLRHFMELKLFGIHQIS